MKYLFTESIHLIMMLEFIVSLKGQFVTGKRAQTVEHLKRDNRLACADVLHHRTIQNSFKKAYSRDEHGDLDESLIPPEILAWYERQ